EPEAPRHHTDHRVWLVVDPDRRADGILSSAKPFLPLAITEHGFGISRAACRKCSPNLGCDTENGEEVRGHGADARGLEAIGGSHIARPFLDVGGGDTWSQGALPD